MFRRRTGTVTAGNASGINDAAAAVVLMEKLGRAEEGPEADGAARRLRPRRHRSRRSWASGRSPRSRARSPRRGSRSRDIDVIESNEAFAAQALGVDKELGLDPTKVNPNGGAVALGHPIGATGCILTDQVHVRAAAHGRALRARHDVHRRRPRHRGGDRTDGLRARADRDVVLQNGIAASL